MLGQFFRNPQVYGFHFRALSSFTVEFDCVFEGSLAGGAGCNIDVLGEDGEGEDEEGVGEDEEGEDR